MMRHLIILFLFNPFLSWAQDGKSIYITSISWHTAIIIPATCLPDSLWPASYDYSEFEYLEIGWGDRDFYQTPGFNPWFAIKAMFWSTKSAIHIFPLQEFDGSYALNELIELELTVNQLKNLCSFLVGNFVIENGKFVPLQEGFYYNSQFFAGQYAYHLPINSNVWIAKALKAAGFQICPIKYQFTEWLIRKAKKLP